MAERIISTSSTVSSSTWFTPEGFGHEPAMGKLDGALRRNRFQAPSGRSFGFYPTYVPGDIAAIHSHIIENYGHDAFSPFGYRGGLEFIDRSLRDLGREFFHCDSEYRGGLVMPSGTLAIQHAIQLALTEYYRSVGHNYLEHGHNMALKPVILAPVHSQFLVGRAAQASGMGADAVRYYNLTDNYETDYENLQETVRSMYQRGETPVLNFLLGGDTQRGLPQDVQRVIEIVDEERPNGSHRPFTLVDAAPHGLNLWAQNRQSEVDFSIPGVDGLIINPQKSDVSPLGGTLFMLRDTRRLGSLLGRDFSNMPPEEFEQERITAESSASWLISRDASPALSFFTALLAKGTNWLRQERERVLQNTHYLRNLIQSRPDLFATIPSDNNVVAFTVRGDETATRRLAEAVNASDQREEGMFIAYSPYIRARNTQEVNEAMAQSAHQSHTNYDGLWATIYPAHTQEDIQHIFSYMCQALEQNAL